MHQIHGKLNGDLKQPKIGKNGNHFKLWALFGAPKNPVRLSTGAKTIGKIKLVPGRETFASIRYMGTFNVEPLMGT